MGNHFSLFILQIDQLFYNINRGGTNTMPNLGNTNRQAYSATVDLYFKLDDQIIDIATERIKYIVIDTNYESEIMPKIYMSISVNPFMYQNIIKFQNEARFKLKMRRKNIFSGSALEVTIIDDEFAYIPSGNNADYLKDISGGSNSDSYRNIIIGLISTKITNTLRQSFNLIYNNIDQETLISIALEGLKTIVQPLQSNHKYDSIIVPPMTSKNDFLKYIFELDNFYNTNFLFFIDFNKAYLLSRDGTMVPDSNDEINDVYIDIKEVSDTSSYFDGIDIINGAYYLYINQTNSNIIIPSGINKIANRLVVIDDDTELQTLDLSINQSLNDTVKQLFIRSENGSVYKSEIEQGNVIIEISKTQIDGFSFTPNKNYIINTGDENSGKYRIASKKEYYRLTGDGEFTTSCYMALRKLTKNITKFNNYENNNKVSINPSAQVSNTSEEYVKSLSISTANNR